LPRDAAEETSRLDGLVAAATEALTHAPIGGEGSPSARVATGTLEQLAAVVEKEKAALQSSLARALEAIPGRDKAARDGCRTAFESLLLRHDLPGTVVTMDLRQRHGEGYTAHVSAAVAYGLRWQLEIAIPSDHVLSRVVRLEKIARAEIHAPELTGWLRKELKLRPQRLDRFYVTQLAVDTSNMTLGLRDDADGTGDGFDVVVNRSARRFQLVRTGAEPHDVSDEDTTRLLELHAKMLDVARTLAASRKRVRDATLDDAPLWAAHAPREVVERLVSVMAPITQEIAAHSLSGTELVLKRSLADDRREEVFVSAASLLSRLGHVPDSLRPVLASLVSAIEHGVEPADPARSA
jgi:hypothetical protein